MEEKKKVSMTPELKNTESYGVKSKFCQECFFISMMLVSDIIKSTMIHFDLVNFWDLMQTKHKVAQRAS